MPKIANAQVRWTSIRFRVLAILLVALAGRTAVLCARYFLKDSATKSFHVETGAFWFVIVAVVLAVTRTTNSPEAHCARPRRAVGEYALWLLGSAALYWPALTVGLLSDDFLLADRAFRFALGSFNSEAFRPLPLAVWGLILHLGGGPVALHALNIFLHGTNAFLTTRVAEPFAHSRRAGVLAGLIVVSMPILVEPVVWCSGVFDVAATTFVLLAVLTSRAYERDGWTQRAGFFACSIAGLLSKETAVVLPVLVAIDAWLRRSPSRGLHRDIALVLCGMGVIGAIRFAFASADVKRPISKYLLQRWVFGTAGGLAAPWHADVVAAHPWLPITFAWIIIALLARFSLRMSGNCSRLFFYAMAAWALVGTAPVITFLFVGPDLQSSRYLYLATIGWAGLLVAMVEWNRIGTIDHGASILAATALVALGVYGVHEHIATWRAAASTRDTFEQVAARDSRLLLCQTIAIQDAPDSVKGAYVLRNGAVAALKRDIGLPLRTGTPAPSCSFTWDSRTETFRRSGQ